ncbi:MAG: PEP-CTERM sorting domain-containing protein, partial [Planctomycetaceae bacterium]
MPSLARWNFAYYIDVVEASFADYSFKLLYDFDPAAGNAGHGVIDFTAALSALMINPAVVQHVEDSQNLGFGFLATTGGGITAPTFPSFDPNANGQYTFALQAYDSSMTTLLGQASILVNTVPEPLSASLFGIGAAGMAFMGYRRRRKAQTA